MAHKEVRNDGIAALVYSMAMSAASGCIGAATELEEALAAACKKAERNVLKISMEEIETEAEALAASTGMTGAAALQYVADRKVQQHRAVVDAYKTGGWAEAGISFEMFAQYHSTNMAEQERHRRELDRNGAAGICPGGCPRNFADPSMYCAGCHFNRTIRGNGGADNGGLSPAT